MREKPSWNENIKSYDFPSLNADAEADVAIIGAGLAGIFTAYLLSKTGKKIILLEAGEILKDSVTAYTTAFVTQIIDTAAADLVKIYGKEIAQEVLQSGMDAIGLIEKIAREEKIECGFMRCPVYIFASREEQAKALHREFEAYQNLKIPAELGNKEDLPFKNYGYLKIPNQAKYQAAPFAQRILEIAVENGVRVYKNTRAAEVAGEKPFTVKTEHGSVRAEKVIIATYQPFNNPKEVLLKKGMYKSYVFEISLGKQNKLEQALYWDLHDPYHYFRVDNYGGGYSMILGGEDHRAEIRMDPQKNFNALADFFKETFGPVSHTIESRWVGPILEPSDGLALIGRIRPNYYLASAFSGNGMTYSAISAMIFKDLIEGRENIYAKTYDPTRFNPKRWIKKFSDYFGEFVGGAAKNIFKDDQDRQKKSGRATGPQAA